MADAGATIVAVADAAGAIHEPNGLNVYGLASDARGGHPVLDNPGAKQIAREALVGVDCDIWIAAAGRDVITAGNASTVRARLVVHGSHQAVTPDAEVALHRRGILFLPDLVAASGGAIGNALEWRGVAPHAVADAIRETIAGNLRAVLGVALRERRLTSEVAMSLALERLEKGMAARRWSVFAGFGAPGLDSRDVQSIEA
jgi:glutamate dehydrogenase (NAD(P)+)